MERRRLPLQKGLVVGVANNAVAGFDTLNGRVTGRAVMFQKPVRLGERTGTGHALPSRFAQHSGAFAAGMISQEVKRAKQRHEQRQCDE